MPTLIAFILFCQALGAIVGVVGAIWGELSYLKAMRDGRIDHAEKAHLHKIAHGLRWGMTLLLIASLALVSIAYVTRVSDQPALAPAYWSLMVLALVVIYVSWALSRGRISFTLGSAIAFTGWWFLAYITLGLFPLLSFGALIAFFVVATAIFYGILKYARLLAGQKR